MKKTLLLAGVACVFAANANAAEFMNYTINPYVGLDYVYSDANIKKEYQVKKDYNSMAINLGTMLSDYASIEAFFQQSGERSNKVSGTEKYKSKFYAYGLDAYGYMPVGCDGMKLLGSVGIANYNMEVKDKSSVTRNSKYDKDRTGYRIGFGAQYDFNEHIAARVMARYSYIGAKALKDLKELTAGVRYTF